MLQSIINKLVELNTTQQINFKSTMVIIDTSILSLANRQSNTIPSR